jgi:hypothetical protein
VDVLLTQLGAFDHPVLVAFHHVDEVFTDVSVCDLVADPRGAAAGLFGLEAPPGASSAGVLTLGTAHHAPASSAPAGTAQPVRLALALGTDGTLRHHLELDEVDHGGDPATGPPGGLLVDALHRVLGLPSPGEPPMLWELVLGWWLRDLIDVLRDDRAAGSADLLSLHPGLDPEVLPSAEDLALATEDVVGDTSWARLHALASTGPGGLEDLTPAEAAWMDPTMFGRWLVGGLPSVRAARSALRDLPQLADRIAAADALLRRRSGLAGGTGPAGTADHRQGDEPRGKLR